MLHALYISLMTSASLTEIDRLADGRFDVREAAEAMGVRISEYKTTSRIFVHLSDPNKFYEWAERSRLFPKDDLGFLQALVTQRMM